MNTKNRPVLTWAGNSERGIVDTFRTTAAPLALLLITPPAVVLFWITCTYLDGSLLRLLSVQGLETVVHHFPRPSLAALWIIVVFAAFELALLQFLPGPTFDGPPTPTGYRPQYKLNGVSSWVLTHVAFLGASYGLGWFSPSIVYDHFGELLITLCASAFVFCWFLYFKGIYAPSTPDAGRSKNVIFDYFWGIELHPSLFGVNLKQLFNCRIGMMGWSLTVISFAARQFQDIGTLSSSLFVSVVLQVVYLLVFFSWERGYFTTIDVAHDRFGYYICWGVIVWVPGVYTITAQYLVKHPRNLGTPLTLALLVMGLGAIWVNDAVDAQRQRVRNTGGQTLIWGKRPEVIHAEYETADGKTHQSLLLVSGYWSLSRHFHYVPELILALAWSLPAGGSRFLPYFYLTFLTILLVDRAGRVDLRCRTKYGLFWDEYCRRVPRKILPWVY